MNQPFEYLEPRSLWRCFKALCQTPRPSGRERAAVELVAAHGKRLGLPTLVDQVGNVLIRKPASPGLEARKIIAVQAHLDMVPQKNNHVEHDFDRDPIIPLIADGWVTAANTSLGADNGIGAAAMMAVLEAKNLKHGPLEALFTVDEETGLNGAAAFDANLLQADILLNLDSEEEGELCIGCAGGIDLDACFEIGLQPAPASLCGVRIAVEGLRGGHSGMDIDKGRGNALRLLVRLLEEAMQELDLCLTWIKGGDLRNAIPREAQAEGGVRPADRDKLHALIGEKSGALSRQLRQAEPGLRVRIENIPAPARTCSGAALGRALRALSACPNGVVRMSDAVPGLVETSISLASLDTRENKIFARWLARSSLDSANRELAEKTIDICRKAGGQAAMQSGYPGWQLNPQSEILARARRVYRDCFKREPTVSAVHAGIECGILKAARPELDTVSFGPTIRNPHSPGEKVDIASVAAFWRLLTKLLAQDFLGTSPRQGVPSLARELIGVH